MKKGKSSVSKAKSYKEMGEFWDTHNLSDHWDKTRKVQFEMDIRSKITYYSIDKKLADQVHAVAKKRGVSADTLLNLWVLEKLQEQSS